MDAALLCLIWRQRDLMQILPTESEYRVVITLFLMQPCEGFLSPL